MIGDRNRPSRRRPLITILILLVGFCMLALIIYNLPPVHDRLAWRVEAFRAGIKYALDPPEEAYFVPEDQGTEVAMVTPFSTDTPTPSLTPEPTSAGPAETATPTPTITPTPTPLPAATRLNGFTQMYQLWNNCGPANLAMALSYWGWGGDQRDVAAHTKPEQIDKNVMPYELADYVAEQTDLSVLARVGGELDILKAFIAAGFPVIVEKGFEGPRFNGWMGHYEVVSGYDDDTQIFYVQDSYDGPNLRISYEDMSNNWRAFNHTYLVIYPPERESEVLSILGPHADPTYNYQYAGEKAAQEITTLGGRDLYFAWFNRGTNLVRLHDYANAATAYDAAFANYPEIPDSERPWRMLWYQTGPYFAYYYSGRYEDVIELATFTLDNMDDPILEESYYWRAQAKLALGDTDGAIKDLRKSLEFHPGFIPSHELLRQLGVEP